MLLKTIRIILSIIFSSAETLSEFLYFSGSETRKEILSLGNNLSHTATNSFSQSENISEIYYFSYDFRNSNK